MAEHRHNGSAVEDPARSTLEKYWVVHAVDSNGKLYMRFSLTKRECSTAIRAMVDKGTIVTKVDVFFFGSNALAYTVNMAGLVEQGLCSRRTYRKMTGADYD